MIACRSVVLMCLLFRYFVHFVSTCTEVLIVYAQKPHLYAHADVSTCSRTRGFQFGLSLHPYPYIVIADPESVVRWGPTRSAFV